MKTDSALEATVEERIYDVEAPHDVLGSIIQLARAHAVECSTPESDGSVSSPLHSPLSGAEIKEVLDFAILIFKTGSAAATFIAAVQKMLGTFGDRGVVRVTDRKTNETSILTADAKTTGESTNP